MKENTVTVEEVADLLLELARHLRRRTHPVRQGELTPEQFWLLKRLWLRGPLRIGELANELGITAGAATVACKRLERAGFVQRARGVGGDERVVVVDLTSEGRERLREWQARRRAFLVRLLETLGPDELVTLYPLLARLLAAAEQEDTGADAPR
jgi:DNA-binding MarR family transcriptional regulator